MKNNQQKIPEGWKETKLSNIGTFSKGQGISKIDIIPSGNNAVRYAELYTKYNFKIKNVHSHISDETAKNATKIDNGDIIFTGSGETIDEIGKSAAYLSDRQCFVGGDTIIFSPKNNNSLYLSYNLNVGNTRKKLRSLGQGQSVVHIYKKDIEKIVIYLPQLPEQNRIVEVLETWDRYLEKLNQKIKLKKNIKKGLMQNLLTGKIRLQNFKEDWCEIKLKDLGRTYSGLTNKSKKDFGFGKRFITYMNIYSNSSINTDIKSLVNVKEGENQSSAIYGDIFFTTSSETPNEVGISSVLLDKNSTGLYLNSFCFGFRLFNFKKLIPEFSKYYFRGQVFRKKMFRIAQGATRYNLSKKYFLEEKIKFPSNIKEQESIANILSIADKEIEILEKQREIIKNQKKYLLNNLITGQIRLPEFINKN